jgi:hypothetical protein
MGIVGLAAVIIILWAYWIDHHRRLRTENPVTQ